MKVLVISEAIAPAGVIASVRWTKIAKYLSKNHGVEVDVLTTSKRYSETPRATYCKFDVGLAQDMRHFYKIWEIPRGGCCKLADSVFVCGEAVLSAVRMIVERFGSGGEEAEASSVTKSSQLDLYGAVLRLKGRSIIGKAKRMPVGWSEYDIVVSSFSPRWVHVLGKWVKDNIPEIPWVADFRDSAVSIPDVPEEEKSTFAQVYAGEADCITGVSQGVIDNLNIPESKMTQVIPNGYDPEDLSSRSRCRSEKFVISYTGTLYSEESFKSDMTPILEAVKEAIIAEDISPEDVLMVYAGASSSLFEAQMRDYADVIPCMDLGLIDRSECYKLQDSSSLLVLCTWNTKEMQGIVTGKIFEYLSSGVPIIGLCSGDLGDSTVKEMLAKAEAGVCYEEANGKADFPMLKSYVLEKYAEWKADGLTNVKTNSQYIASFGYDSIAERYYDLFRSLQKVTQ